MSDDAPSAPLSRDAAFEAFCEVVERVPDLDARDALREAAIHYAHAAAIEVLHSVYSKLKKVAGSASP